MERPVCSTLARDRKGDLVSPLGERVRVHRNLLGLSQHALADRVGITQARISQIEAGQVGRRLPRRTLTDLADGLGIGLGELIGGDPAYIEVLLETPSPVAEPSAGLPPLATSLIGRETELATIADLLKQGVRLLSLVGPGGVGKTHLALHAARDASSTLPVVTVVSLLACPDVALFIATVARAIGVREHDSHLLRERVLGGLGSAHRLVLLDNVEQALPTVGPLITELLAACPRVTLLVTSRTPLGLRGESIIPITPLPLPTAEAPSLADIAASPAVQLFLQRAEATSAPLGLTAENASTIAEIVRRLDGLPLAIELAAARTRAFSLAAVLGRLDSRLAFLSGGPRDLPARQRTLRDAIGWSYNLLTAEERRLFRHLAVFAGGFTAEAAASVVVESRGVEQSSSREEDGSGQKTYNPSPDNLDRILDWSHLGSTEQADGTVRLGMRETVHEFAREQLASAGEMAALRRRHLAWCSFFTAQAVSELNTPAEPASLRRLAQEEANIQAALTWAFASEDDADLELGLTLVDTVAAYWLQCGRQSDARAWLTRAIAASANREPTLGRARVLAGARLIEQTHPAVEAATRPVAPVADAVE
jgi:predicted ATPase/DNA-binding XRE family transcriptional regulator